MTHSAEHLVSEFLGSKRALKKIYGLNPTAVCLLRYIAFSIDKNAHKHARYCTRLFHAQIMRYNFMSRPTITKQIKFLVKKRFIRYNKKTQIFHLGKTILAFATITYPQKSYPQGKESFPPIDVERIFPPHRYGKNLSTSNISNITNNNVSSFIHPYEQKSNSEQPKPRVITSEMSETGKKGIASIKILTDKFKRGR